jgi:hypothetical protein
VLELVDEQCLEGEVFLDVILSLVSHAIANLISLLRRKPSGVQIIRKADSRSIQHGMD